MAYFLFKVMEIDTMQVDLWMDSVYVRELLAVKWFCETGLVENIEHVVEEYRQSRQLLVHMIGKKRTTSHQKGGNCGKFEIWC